VIYSSVGDDHCRHGYASDMHCPKCADTDEFVEKAQSIENPVSGQLEDAEIRQWLRTPFESRSVLMGVGDLTQGVSRMHELEKANLLRLIDEHRQHCKGEDCDISISTVAAVFMRAGIVFTADELGRLF